MNDGTAQREALKASAETLGRDVTVYDPAVYERDRTRVERGFWGKLRRVAGRIPFAEEAAAAYYCTRDSATPIQAKAVIMAALAYFVIPTDMIPDFIAGLGFGDDAAVFLFAWQAVSKHVTDGHREKARRTLAELRGDPISED